MSSATAIAHPNIALVKYWGKRDAALNLPAVGSISITLDTLATTTSVQFDSDLDRDTLSLDGQSSETSLGRVSACLDLLRARAGVDTRAAVSTSNNFPTGAGLASSASGFAALVTAADAALSLDLPPQTRSILARQGSGSAARSIFGGYVEMHLGKASDGSDCFAEPLLDAPDWPMTVTVAVVSKTSKKVGSTEGMELTRHTSPYYDAWVAGQSADLDEARSAIEARDFDKLAEISEHSCLKMHALAAAARPGLVYLQGPTLEAMHRVRALRASGCGVFFTIDAGPQLKAISLPEHRGQVTSALADIDGVVEILQSGLGEGARVV
ncbi:MAG: diphosphomevalonate decarboxylase [Gammaproteobacteria bacterium]|nr:diphosphomevalonate decarboxylase [Gammaproteobacteria bacterium]